MIAAQTLSLVLSLLMTMMTQFYTTRPADESHAQNRVELPQPQRDGKMSLEQTIEQRRSVRDFTDQPVTLRQLSQLLWSAQGITSPDGLRAVPSAGATYPLEIYLVAGNVEGLPSGIYRYIPKGHQLQRVASGDHRSQLAQASLNQPWVRQAPASILIAAAVERTRTRYGSRAEQYVFIEAGGAMQNIYLQAVALDLSSVCVGAFEEQKVKKIARLTQNELPILLMVVGNQKISEPQ